MSRWFMKPTGYEPVVGNRFTFSTTPAGAWDGTIHCQVLEVVSNERLTYAWKGGHADNVGYVSLLDTVVTWSLARTDARTRVRVVHCGFVLPKNETAYKNMSNGWRRLSATSLTRPAHGTEEQDTKVYTGGCACGAISYEIRAEPIVMLDCQSRQCQRASGTGHGSHLTFPRAAVEVAGEATRWEEVRATAAPSSRRRFARRAVRRST